MNVNIINALPLFHKYSRHKLKEHFMHYRQFYIVGQYEFYIGRTVKPVFSSYE